MVRPTRLRQSPAPVSQTIAPTDASQTSAKQPDAKQPDAKQPDAKQPCVLLKNDNVLFGSALQRGEYIVIRRGLGNEIRLPRQDVACWADSVGDLYRYRVDHRHAGDLSAHARDARWCLQYELFDLASEEIRAVLAIDPENEQAHRLQRQLQRIVSPPTQTVSPPTQTRMPSPALMVKPAGYDDPPADLTNVDLAALQDFAGNVQPMLVNRCGRCHSHTTSRTWQLLTPSSGSRASSRMTRENLASSLRYVNRNSPGDSELLVKAMTPHGGGPASLDPRRSKAIEALQGWLNSIASSPSNAFTNDQMDGESWRADPFPSPNESSLNESSLGESSLNESSLGELSLGESSLGESSLDGQPLDSWRSDRPVTIDTPARLPEVANPFNPDLFNRRFHPQ